MVKFKPVLERFAEKGEKTGWTYLHIPEEIAQQLNPGIRKSYRVKGLLDALPINQQAILPMGEGDFILPVKKEWLKQLKKPLGEKIQVTLDIDTSERKLDEELMLCLAEAPDAEKKFLAMPSSHQWYYSNHVHNAKTDATKAKRIAHVIESLQRGLSFSEMLKMK